MIAIKPSPDIYRKAAKLKPSFTNAINRACDLIYRADEFIAEKTSNKFEDCINYNDSRRSAKPVIKMLNDIADALEKEQAGDQGS